VSRVRAFPKTQIRLRRVENAVFDLASVSKVLTTLAIDELIQDGRLRLDETLGNALGRDCGKHHDVTVEDLLRHRGGLAPWLPLYLSPTQRDPIDDVLASQPINPPGRSRVYSDLGMQLLGRIIEVKLGRDLADAIRHVIPSQLSRGLLTERDDLSPYPVVPTSRGDVIEREMVRTQTPFPTPWNDQDFLWRTERIIGEVNDCNAYYSYAGIAGHAGWFASVGTLLDVGTALLRDNRFRRLVPEINTGQGLGVQVYRTGDGQSRRTWIGHSGFTGSFLAASPRTAQLPEQVIAFHIDRLYNVDSGADRAALLSVEQTSNRISDCLNPDRRVEGG
jgi:CubicO group peptidase (beta-lactamase class C family)